MTAAFLGQCGGVDPGDQGAGTTGDAGAGSHDPQAQDALSSQGPPADAPSRMDMSAGTADRPSTDAKPVLSFAPPQCSDALDFCEDFEAAALDAAKWTTWTNAATLGFDPLRTVGGKRALHVKVNSTAEPPSCAKDENTCVLRGGSLETVKTFPVGGNNLYVRFYVWIDKVTPDRWFPIANLADDKNLGGFGVNVAAVSPKEGARLTFELCGGNQCVWGGAADTEQWACWEIEYRGKNEVNLYVNDKQVPKLTAKLGAADPEVVAPLWLGFRQGHPDIHQHVDGFNIWFDEVAVSTKKIGCFPKL